MSYATVSDWIARTDVKRLGDLAQDNNIRATPTQLLTNTRILACLADASGLIDSSLMRGNRYTPADLAGLPTNGNALLLRLNCDLAYGLLIQARGYSPDELAKMAPEYERALAMLDRLSNGEWIFATPGAINAGRTAITALSSNVVLLTQKAYRYFGNLGCNSNSGIHD